MKKLLIVTIMLMLGIMASFGQGSVRPPVESGKVTALNELDARKTIKWRGDSLVKNAFAYVEWDANCFRFRRITTGAPWSSWICAEDGESTSIAANAQDVLELIGAAIAFKVQSKHSVLQSDENNNFRFKGNLVLNSKNTVLGSEAGISGYDSLFIGADTLLVAKFDSTYVNTVLIGHNAKAVGDSTVVLGDETIKQVYTGGAFNGSGFLFEGDTVYLQHLVNLTPADSGKIAMNNGAGVEWIDQKADSIMINGEWVKLGGSLTLTDSIQINGEWVQFGGTVTTPDEQNLSWDGSTGALGISGGTGVNLDGRYLTEETPQNLSWNPTTGALGIDGGTGVDLDGRYLTPPTATDGQIMIKAGTDWVASNLPPDERARVVYSDGSSSASALFSSEDFEVKSVGGAIDDNVIFAIKDSLFSVLQNKWVYSGDTIETEIFQGDSLYLASENRWLYSGDTIPNVSANIGGAALLGNFTLSDTITHPIGFIGTVLTLLSWNGNTIDGFTNAGGYLTANEDLNLTINQNYLVTTSEIGATLESVLFLKINDDMFELPYAGGNEVQGSWNSGTMSFPLSEGDEVRAYVFSRWTGLATTKLKYTYINWYGYMTAIKSVVGDIVEYDPLSIHKTDTLFYVSDGTTAEPVLQGDTIAKTGTLGMKDIWTGTQAEYDLIGTPDANTVYFINNGWWVLAFLLLFSFSGFGQKWDAVKIGSTDIVRIYQGANIIWEKESEPTGAYIILKTDSESDAWGHSDVTNSGATLHWEVTGAATYSVDTNLPVFDFSAVGEKIITITSSDDLTGLQYLNLSNNQLTSINATGLTGLQYLSLDDNQLTSFDATGLTGLQNLYLNSNQLTSFDATGLTGLQNLYLSNNQLTSINATGLTGLQYLDLYENQLTSFDATGLTGLQELDLSENQLTSFDATGLTGFQELFLSYNQLTTISINSMLDQLVTIGTAGTYLDASNQFGGGCGDPAKIAALDAIWGGVFVDACAVEPTGYIVLKTDSESDAWSPSYVANSGATLHWEVTGAATYSVDTDIPEFDFTTPGEKTITITSADDLTGLQVLDLSDNQLTSFDATSLTGLQTLYVDDNQLTSFDATGLTGLQNLYLNSNQLTYAAINAMLDQLISIGTAGNQLDAAAQTGGGCGDLSKIAALGTIWGTVLVDACE